jgi:flagellar assembly protein FliH
VADPVPESRRAFDGPAASGTAPEAARHVASSPSEATPEETSGSGTWQEGYEAGRAEGLEAGREQGAAAARAELPFAEAETLRTAAGALEEAARSVAALRRGYLAENRRLLVELAVAVAERVLARRIEADPDALLGVVERALAELGDAPELRLKLSERDRQAVEAGRALELAAFAERHGVAVEADPALAPGDVRILAGRTQVDARIGVVLRRIREELVACADAPEAAGDEPCEASGDPPLRAAGDQGLETSGEEPREAVVEAEPEASER